MSLSSPIQECNHPPDKCRYIIFTDLDGTLLDHDTYEYRDALEALNYIRHQRIPLILCSSKTRAEIEYYRKELGLEDPFIVENGATIFIPKGILDTGDMAFVEYGDYKVIELGTRYSRIKDIFAAIKAETGLKLSGFSEMSVDQVVELTGLGRDMAALAQQRDYSEPFLFEDAPWCVLEEEARLADLERAAEKRGLKVTRGGRFYHLTGDNDKGKAVQILKRLYEPGGRVLVSIGLGDSPNDFPMLEHVDIPVLVKKKDGQYAPWSKVKKVILAPDVGPKGWNRAVLDLVR
ncbi:MAG: HAD-IIB family hydrolase [Thermodesulfobacteriota bacterium]|nr:HAD-IIB family hydrolase [Thermodesulfobacteriota bacterium]